VLDPSRPTLKALAARFGKDYRAVRKRAVGEKWRDLREKMRLLNAPDDLGSVGRILTDKALKAIVEAETTTPSESIRLLELALKLDAFKAPTRKRKPRYVAEWGKNDRS